MELRWCWIGVEEKTENVLPFLPQIYIVPSLQSKDMVGFPIPFWLHFWMLRAAFIARTTFWGSGGVGGTCFWLEDSDESFWRQILFFHLGHSSPPQKVHSTSSLQRCTFHLMRKTVLMEITGWFIPWEQAVPVLYSLFWLPHVFNWTCWFWPEQFQQAERACPVLAQAAGGAGPWPGGLLTWEEKGQLERHFLLQIFDVETHLLLWVRMLWGRWIRSALELMQRREWSLCHAFFCCKTVGG